MTTKVDIPGGFAILREQHELRGRDRMLIKAAAMAAAPAIEKMPTTVTEGQREDETEEEAQQRMAAEVTTLNLTWQESMALLELRQATMIACLKEWSLPLPLPTMDTVGDLDADLYDALDTAIGGVTTAVAAATDFDPQPGKENPTGNSKSSGSPSKDGVPKQLTPSTQSSGENIATESSTQD
jgi:hypothetical protein